MILFRSFIGSSFVFIGYYLDKLKCFEGKWLLLSIVSLGYFLNGGTDMRTLTVGNVLLYYMFAICGTMLIFLVAKTISQYGVNQLFTKWGGYSLLIMCTHTIFMVVQTVNYITFKTLGHSLITDLITVTVVMTIESILIKIYSFLSKNYPKLII